MDAMEKITFGERSGFEILLRLAREGFGPAVEYGIKLMMRMQQGFAIGYPAGPLPIGGFDGFDGPTTQRQIPVPPDHHSYRKSSRRHCHCHRCSRPRSRYESESSDSSYSSDDSSTGDESDRRYRRRSKRMRKSDSESESESDSESDSEKDSKERKSPQQKSKSKEAPSWSPDDVE